MGLFTRLSTPDVAAIAAAYGLGRAAALEVEGIPYGTINSNYRARADGRTYFLRVNEGKTEAEVEHEATLVAHLAARGVRTPVPLPTVAGPRWAKLSCGLVSIFPWMPGAPRDDAHVTPADVRGLGALLGRLHAAGAGFTRRHAGRYGFDVIVSRLQALATDPALDAARAALGAEATWLTERAAQRAALPAGVIHGDLFPDNVLWDDDGPIAIDFEQASDGTLAYDVAVCLLAWAWDGRALDPARLRALVDGYEAVRPLAPAERAGLWIEARAAAMRFTVTRIGDVFLSPDATPEVRRVKDFRAYLARLEALRTLGDEGFRAACFGDAVAGVPDGPS